MGRLGAVGSTGPPWSQSAACVVVSLSLSDVFSLYHILPALYRDVEAAEKQCKELEKVVALIENNRQRFRHIDNVRASCFIHRGVGLGVGVDALLTFLTHRPIYIYSNKPTKRQTRRSWRSGARS